ncbi:MAG: VWA domain-containing protein [Bacteroidia bacterium]
MIQTKNIFSNSFSRKFFIVLFIIANCQLPIANSFLFAQNKPAPATEIKSAPKQITRILFLYDDSQSMISRWESDTKYEVAKRMVSTILDSLKHTPDLELALRVFGHTKRYPPQDCDDTRLEVPFGKDNGEKIKKKLTEIKPSGTTPIARSLEECAKDFSFGNYRNIIILITDGIEECNGDPCAVSQALQKKGIVLKPFIIGLGITKDFVKQFECVGNYYDAQNEEQFRTALNVVISQALNNTTCQVNLLDVNQRPTETNVAMTFYEKNSGTIKYNFVHTLNGKGNPDTLHIDPLGVYKIVVHTIPPVSKDDIKLTPGKHTIIGIDAPQGDLMLKYEGNSEYKNLKCIVRKKGDMKTLNVQDFNTKEKYIVGDYDLEVLCLPRMLIENVEITQSHTTTVQIPNPGIATFLMTGIGYGTILVEDKNELKWVIDLDDSQSKQTLVLQPGNYRVVFRPKNSVESEYTIEKSFKVASGSSATVIIN